MTTTKLTEAMKAGLALFARGEAHLVAATTHCALERRGLIEKPERGPWVLTDAGRKAVSL